MSGAHFKSAAEVVSWLGCVQSQEYQLAKWSLGVRADGLRDADVDSALANGRILRTHILRPTWHFVVPQDIRWIMALTAPKVERFLKYGSYGSTPDQRVLRRGVDVIREALGGGKRLTRVQLVRLLNEKGVSADPIQTGRMFVRAELDLVIASGGLVGKAQTYALLDEIAPPAIDAARSSSALDRDWALGELTRRFFTSHGPATIADFTWWSSLTVADTKRGIEVSGHLDRIEANGADYWWAGDVGGDGTDAGSGEASPTVHLMQGYDEYIVSHRSPRDVINVDRLIPASAMTRPPFLHAMVLDTQGVGWWRRVNADSSYAIDVKLARGLTSREETALAAEVARYEQFVDLPVSLGHVEIANGATLAGVSEGGMSYAGSGGKP